MGPLSRAGVLVRKEEVIFVVSVDRTVCSTELERDVWYIPADLDETNELEWWREHRIEADAIVFDVSHEARVAKRAAVLMLLRDVGGNSASRVVIDGMGVHTLVDAAGWSVDAVLLPYAGAVKSQFVPRTLCERGLRCCAA